MAVIGIVAELVALGLPIAEDIIAAVAIEMRLSGAGVEASVEERAQIDAAMDAAHAALQAATEPKPGPQ